ncbi:hypothetical protein OG921_21660 [Aldersonia sp. NBC_00410]|uniref:hypothetical protein n=1 Tax=Aldersonia sp. NBC_00410 TaxID=2975954 RepID=UPI00225BB802|nr:hypothetical protein [Aldersonia sp. NBC_00410]MCX5045777.1 hypothetical protein [Aldersonia sp. NBC_00410]
MTSDEHRRAAAIEARRTDRLPFGAPPRWGQFRETLTELLDDYGAHAALLSQDTRNDLAEASRLTAARRRYDSLYRAELHWWTGHAPHADGVPATLLAAPAEATRVPVGRAFGVGGIATETTPQPTMDESALLVLGTDGDDRLDCLRGGEALSAVLLEATMAGYATCPLTHLTELPASRAVVARLAADGRVPQVVIRVGVAQAPDRPRTARRDVSEVFVVRHPGDGAP